MLNLPFSSLDEEPFLSGTMFDDSPLEKELLQQDSLKGLVTISRNLIKNNPVAGAFLISYLNAFMGGAIVLNKSGQKKMINQFDRIIKPSLSRLDINGSYNLSDVMEFVIQRLFVDGDCLVHMPMDKQRTMDLKSIVEIIPSSRIETPKDLKRNSFVRNGIKYSAGGRIEGYYVKPFDAPYDPFTSYNHTDYEFIPIYTKNGIMNAKMVLSPLTRQSDSGRAYPALQSSSRILRFLMQTLEAVVISLRVSSCYAGFITTKDPAGKKRNDNARIMKGIGKLSPGTIYYLERGESVDFSTPGRPADNVDSFLKSLIEIAGANVRLPYQIAMLNLEKTSFSSWKGGTNEIEANRSRWLNTLNSTGNFIIKRLMLEAVINGKIKGDLNNLDVSIRFPRYDALDAEKRARADSINLKNGVTSIHEISDETNREYMKIQEELELEAKTKIERQAKLVKYATEQAAKYDIDVNYLIPTNEDEEGGTDLEDKHEKRKEDGNW